MKTATQHALAASAFLLFLATSARDGGAQVIESWSRIHDFPPAAGNEQAAGVAFRTNGDVVVAGTTTFSGGGGDFALVGYAADGSLASSWTGISAPNIEIASAFVVDPSDAVVIAGSSDVFVPPSTILRRSLLVKVDASGALAWSTIESNTLLQSLRNDDGGYLVLGANLTGGSAPASRFLRRITSGGSTSWTWTAPSNVVLAAMGAHPGGDEYAVGSAGTPPAPYVARVSGGSGALVWSLTVGGLAGPAELAHAATDAAGTIYAAGRRTDVAAGFLVAVDPSGVVLWSRTFDTVPLFGPVRDVDVDAFGRVLVVGTTSAGMVLAAFDGSGALLWERARAGLDAQKLALDPRGNVAVLAHLDSSVEPQDLAVVGFDAAGNERWAYESSGVAGASSELGSDLRWQSPAVLAIGATTSLTGQSDLLSIRLQRTAVPLCFGDGSGAACPCGNASAPVESAGCAHSLGVGGRLVDGGLPSLSSDTLVLEGSAMPESTALYFQGSLALGAGAGAPFGDGLRCAGGALVRLGTKSNAGGASRYPGPGDASVSAQGSVAAPGERIYQVWFRNAAAFCTSATFNATNALSVAWLP